MQFRIHAFCSTPFLHPEIFQVTYSTVQYLPFLGFPQLNPVSEFVLFKYIFHIDVITRHVSHSVIQVS